MPTVKASGGGRQDIDWPAIQKEEDAEEDGPGFFYSDCSQGVDVVSASSELKPQGTKNYSAKNLADSNPMTAWVEGKPGYGIGESFSVKSRNVNIIYNGYQATPASWKNNSRVKKFKVYKDNKPLCFLTLTDDMGEQNFNLPFKEDDKSHVFKFEIVEVYKGLKWDDTGISHVDYGGCCVSAETLISFEGEEKPVDEVEAGQKIRCLNLNDNSTFDFIIPKVIKQTHVALLEITTINHQIKITADHPLLMKDGFSSLSRLRISQNQNDYDFIIGTELMIWNEPEKKMKGEKITSIREIEGTFNTYTLKGLPENTAYIANGFLTKSY